MIDAVAAFLVVSLVVIVTPGQDTALTIRNTLVSGRRSGAFTGLGVAAGQGVWTVAASAGLTALLLASEPAFQALRLAGAAFLVYLGAQALRAAVRPRTGWKLEQGGARRRVMPGRAFRQGLVSNLGNPKMAVFFTSLLPQAAPGDPSFLGLFLLGLVFCLMTLTWLATYAVAIARVGEVLRRPRVLRAVDALTGLALIGFGLRLAAERR